MYVIYIFQQCNKKNVMITGLSNEEKILYLGMKNQSGSQTETFSFSAVTFQKSLWEKSD